MGLFDLPGPVFGFIDQSFESFLPPNLRLSLWGVLAGWMAMQVYRTLSNQEKIRTLKVEQKDQQKKIAEFDGELTELFSLIRHTLGLGMHQLRLSLGPALVATLPVLFLVVWVGGRFGYDYPAPGDVVSITTAEPAGQAPALSWHPAAAVTATSKGWDVRWPADGQAIALTQSDMTLLKLPMAAAIPVVHKRRWWNLLTANPIGYIPERATLDRVDIALPAQQFLPFGPHWIRGWMFTFFGVFLLSSVAFKLASRID